MLKQVKQEDIIKASQERDQQRQNAYRSTSQAANNKKSGISTAKTRTTTQKKTTSKSKSKFSDSPLFTAAKKFLSANDDAAEMTYGVYNPKARERTRAGNTLGAAGKSYQAGQANALAFLLGQDQDKVDKTRADARKYMIEHGYAKASDFGESKTDKWLAEQSGKLTDSARRLNAEAAEHEAAAKQGLGKAGQTLVDVGIAGSQMLLDAGVGALTGTGMLSMGSRTFGQATREALDNGATRGQAALYGAGSAAVEVGTEKLFDAVKLFGGGATDDLLEAAVGKLAKTDAGRTALRAVGNMGGEAVEELISGIVNPVLRASYDPNAMKDYKTREYWTDNLHDALVGAILGAAGAGGSIITGQNAVNNAALRQQETAQAAQAEAQRMAEFNQRQQRQRDYFAGNTMQTGTADAEAAVVLNRNAQARGEVTPAMIAEVVKATPDPARAMQNLQAMQTRQAEQNAVQATPAASSGIQELETVKQAIGRNPTFDDLINYYSQQGESGVKAYQRIAGAFERGELVDGGNSGIYTRAEIEQRQTSMPEADHIDNRTPEYNSKVSTKPFQLTHPELHPYFAEAAKALQQEAVNSFMSDMPNMKGGKVYNISVGLKRVMDMTGLSRQKISECCQDIIDNHGAEDYASAKHVEAALDYLMTNGAQFQNEAFPSNQAYLEAKGKITGGTDPNTFDYALEHEYGNLIAMEEMTVDEARAEWEKNHPQQTPANPANAETTVTPESSVGAATQGFNAEGEKLQERYDEAIEKYGAHPERSTLARQQEVPKQMNDDTVVPRTVQSAIGAEVTPSDAASDIADTVARGGFDRAIITDKESLSKAEAEIKDKGWDSALADWTVNVKSGRVSKDNIALGLTLYNNAVNNGNTKAAVNILTDLVDNARAAAQAVQAMSLLQKLTPENRLYGVQRSVENLERSLKDKFGDRAPELEIDRSLMEEYLNAKDDQGRADAMDKIYQNIADQIPASWSDKFNSWRYLAMLGNPRTHIRNIVGNLGFAPVRGVKNIVATGLERVAIGKAGAEGRTKSIVPAIFKSKADKARYQAAIDEWSEVEPLVQSGGKYNDDFNEIRNRQTVYTSKVLGKALEWLRQKNGAALDAEDVWFSRPAYASSLAQYLKANNITAEQYNSPGFDKTAAREYAILEAQKATYRDTNDFSETISKLGKTKFKPVNTLVEAILPFKKTPANILARGVEYSPIGMLNGLKQMVYDVQKGNKTAAEAIDTLASGLTGTGIMALGYLLASQGLLRGGKDEDKDQANFDTLQGHQPYSLEIGNTSITLDWLAPEALPLFVGVEFFNILKDGFEPGDNIFKPFQQISEPVLEMSMLSGINDVLDSITYSDSKTWAVLSSAATSYLSQYIPTIFGQIERVTEDTRQSTYTEKDSYIPTDIQYALGKAANKLPGEYNQMNYLNAWGESQSTGNVFQRALSNFVNPAYTSKITTSDVDRELARLNERTGATDIYPANMYNQPAMKFDGEQKALTQKQKEAYQKAYGQTYKNMARSLMQSGEYQALSDADKATAMKLVEQYAATKGKQAVGADAEEPSWATKTEGSVQQNAVYHTMYQSAVKAYRENNDIPSGKKLSDMQIISAIADKGYSLDTTLQLARQGVSSNSTAVEKVEQAATQYDIDPATWAKIYMSADADGNGSIKKDEAKNALANYGADIDAYHLFNKKWK